MNWGKIAYLLLYILKLLILQMTVLLDYILCCTYEFLSVDKSKFSIFIYKYINKCKLTL